MMKVLVVCRYKGEYNDNVAPFVKEQVDSVKLHGVECDYFLVKGKGIKGYFSNLKALRNKIKVFQPDVVHAHYGLCGLLANLQRKVPVVTTYHGSDVNDRQAFRFSRMAIRLSTWNVFVTRSLMNKAGTINKCSLIPCGVDLCDLQLTEKAVARQKIGLSMGKRYVLFAGSFENAVKDAPLAKKVVGCLDAELLELRDYSREEVTLLMCSADALLMTSKNEGSPQVIKEAMACGCPIVSVDVGDVRERVDGVDGCFVTQTRDPQELADLLFKALAFEGRTQGRDKLVADGLDNRQVSEQLVGLYEKVCVG